MSGAALLKEADVGGSFHYGGVNSVILCRRFQRRGGLLKSIQLGGSHMCNVFQPCIRTEYLNANAVYLWFKMYLRFYVIASTIGWSSLTQ